MSELKSFIVLYGGKFIRAYKESEADKVIAKKDAEIAELKKKLMPCLNGDCILTCEVVEKYGKENAELKAELDEKDKDIAYWREEYDKETQLTDALKDEIESLKASNYAEMVDAGMRERRLKRALWLARALALSRFDVDEYLRKHTHYNSRFWNDGFNTFNEACEEMQKAINIAEAKCRAKAEEYK